MNFIMNSRKRQVMRNICSLCKGNKASLSGISILVIRIKIIFPQETLKKSAEDYAALSDQNIRWMPFKSTFGFHGKYMDGSISDSVGISVCREFDF